MEKVTDYKDAASYNNFYEFGTDKSIVQQAQALKLGCDCREGQAF